MIDYNTEYFINNNYFFLKDKGDTISLYYTVGNTLVESRKKDKRMDFKKKDEEKVKKEISKILTKKTSEKNIEKRLKNIKDGGEIEELVDADGGLLSSKIPMLNQTMHPKKTTDQIVATSRVTNDPVTRGYRVYWSENEDKGDDVVSEIDYSDAFGYDETKDMDYKDTVDQLEDMGVENPDERAKEMGKLPKEKRKNGKLRQRITEKAKLEEERKQRMIKMVEYILSKKAKENDMHPKKSSNDDIISKNTPVNKLITKNLISIKKLAEKEGISLNKLINILKKDE